MGAAIIIILRIYRRQKTFDKISLYFQGKHGILRSCRDNERNYLLTCIVPKRACEQFFWRERGKHLEENKDLTEELMQEEVESAEEMDAEEAAEESDTAEAEE